ncbi:MAG: hypothetical protein ACOYL6_09770 [Bacteriovoracaceae bacterium]
MKFVIGFFLLSTGAFAQVLPHLDLEMSSNEYRTYFKTHNLKIRASDPESIQVALRLGERLSNWIEAENKNRPSINALRLTSPGTRTGIPIDKAKIYSDKTVDAEMKTLLVDMPDAMKSVILSTDDFPVKLPVSDEIFINLGRRLDKIYQTSARYKALIPNRAQYEVLAQLDVRGYYFLNINKWDATKLSDVSVISADDAIKVKAALVGICVNNNVVEVKCQKQVEDAWGKNNIAALYTNWITASAKIWNNFFNIKPWSVRHDIDYRDANVMNVPFNTPSISKFKAYLKDNLEDEWKFNTWNLRIIFGDYSNGPELIFQTGVVPHVNVLGGSRIVMDSNQSIEEYESQWTIRHEFGHVLGLPDCYHEFYDSTLQAFVNYQLDITDLMCSRAGNMNERLYKELTKTYHH